MKSSLATRKFDRLFSKRGENLSSNTAANQPNANSTTDEKGRGVVNKEVRWKLDDLDSPATSARSRQLKEGRRRLEVALRGLQTSLLEVHKLSLEEEVLKELQEHYIDLVQSGSGSGGGGGKLWRENHLKQLQGESVKKVGEELFEETLASVIASLERLGLPPVTLTASSSIIGGGGDEEGKKMAGLLTNSTGAVKSTLEVSAKGGGSGRWQFWFWRSDQRYLKWDHGLLKLGSPFNQVEQMRALLGQLLEVDEVAIPSDYSVFREGVKPKWEDVANLEGGAWSVEFARSEVALVGAIWRRLLEFLFEGTSSAAAQMPPDKSAVTAATSSTFLNSTAQSHICGLKISMRFKAYQISVWTGRFVDLEKTLQVGTAVQRIIADLVARVSPNHLQQQQPLVLHYRVHKSALVKEHKRQSSYQNAAAGGGSGNGRFSDHQIF